MIRTALSLIDIGFTIFQFIMSTVLLLVGIAVILSKL